MKSHVSLRYLVDIVLVLPFGLNVQTFIRGSHGSHCDSHGSLARTLVRPSGNHRLDYQPLFGKIGTKRAAET